MQNPGSVKMSLGNNQPQPQTPPEPPKLTVEQRNELFDKHKETLAAKASFKAGDVVTLNDLGEELKLPFMDAGQKAYVNHWGQAVTKQTNDESRDTELHLFNENGALIRVATDARFLKKVK